MRKSNFFSRFREKFLIFWFNNEIRIIIDDIDCIVVYIYQIIMHLSFVDKIQFFFDFFLQSNLIIMLVKTIFKKMFVFFTNVTIYTFFVFLFDISKNLNLIFRERTTIINDRNVRDFLIDIVSRELFACASFFFVVLFILFVINNVIKL